MTWNRNQKIKFDYSVLYKEHIPKPRMATSWSNRTYNKLKKHIKKHHSVFQDNKCAYCRLPINFGGYGEPIEHIVPKSHKNFWMFHPKNLCLSCYGCNTKKGYKNVLFNEYSTYPNGYHKYPSTSNDFAIIHPHLDNYSKHIKINDIICVPNNNSAKGKTTIEICKLNRLDLLHKRVLQKRYSRKRINEIYMQKLRDPTTPKFEKDAITDYAQRIAANYNYKRKVINTNK
jgi:uncharacterized protein (TIGR02646 family)